MQTFRKHLTHWRLIGLCLTLPFLLSGCGGGGESSSETPTPTITSPKNLVGAVLLITYSDSRSYTFTVTNSVSTGLTRSDGRVVTNWTASGYGTPVLGMSIAYGAFTDEQPAANDNVYDDYILSFDSKTEGTVVIREDTTNNDYADATVITGTFKFTTYPPSG